MGKEGIGPYMRDLLSERKFDFVCVQETILQDFSEKWLRKFDPKKN
jgi:hypothetical protein